MMLKSVLLQRFPFRCKRLHDSAATLCTSATFTSLKSVIKSNTVCLLIVSKRQLAFNQLITSVALMGTAQSHVLNTEGKMMQRVLYILEKNDGAMPTIKELLKISKSTIRVTNAVGNSQMILNKMLQDVLPLSDTAESNHSSN